MASVDQVDLPTISIFSKEFERDPFPIYEAARAQHWLARCELGYVVVSHDAAGRLFRDGRLVMPGDQLAAMMGATGGPWHRWLSTLILGINGQAHVRLRRLVGPVFTATQAEKRRAVAREIFRGRLEPHLASGRLDLAQVASSFSVRVLCDLIGVDDADVPKFWDWARTMGSTFDMKSDMVPELDAAVLGMWDYVGGMLAKRAATASPPGDLLQALIDASEENDRLSKEELLNLVTTMLAGGADTTAGALTQTVYALLTEPGGWAALVDDPRLIPSAVEEGLRFRPVASAVPRITVEDISCLGIEIPAGSFLLIGIAGANRDPAVFEEAGTFDLGRNSDRPLASFGLGPHFCLGANIARVSLQVALEELVGSLADPKLIGPVEWKNPLGTWAPKSLGIGFGLR